MLSNISRTGDNQIMKIGQLIECNMRSIFLKNHAQNAVEKLVPVREITSQEKNVNISRRQRAFNIK